MTEDKVQGNSEDRSLTKDDIEELDFWNKEPIPEDQRNIRMQVQKISESAIISGSCLTDTQIEAFQTNIAADARDNFCEVVVLTVDIRESSMTLVNVEDPADYNRVLSDFICHIKNTWRSEPGRFFDKFTGDGALCFWVLPEEPAKHEATKKDKDDKSLLDHYYYRWNDRIKKTINYAIGITCKFMEIFVPKIRKTCGLIPKGFGLSVGIDVGNCYLTELRSSLADEAPGESFGDLYEDINIPDIVGDEEEKDREKQRVRVSFNVTVIGRAVIGATRMVSAATAYEILVNCYPGSALKARIDDPREREIRKNLLFGLDLVFRDIKECPDGVEAYRVNTGRIDHLKRELGLVERDEEDSKSTKKETKEIICKPTKSKQKPTK